MQYDDTNLSSAEEITTNIIDRLPGFYRAREKNSLFYDFIDGFSKTINDQKKLVSAIAKSHWVHAATGNDLDRLASIVGLKRKRNETNDQFRSRITSTLTDFKRGSTVDAMRAQIAAYLTASIDDIVIVENPETPMKIEKQATSGDVWTLSSMSINDEQLAISISIEDGEASDPTIIDIANKVAFRYKGILKKGQKLEIRKGSAKLDGIDVGSNFLIEEYTDPRFGLESTNSSVQFLAKEAPKIRRKPSKWLYREKLTDTLGRFDESKFDESIFYKLVPPTTVTFIWNAHLLACIEVRVPSWLLEKNNLTKSDLEASVNAIRAAGVRSYVTLIEKSLEEKSVDKNKAHAPEQPLVAATEPKKEGARQ